MRYARSEPRLAQLIPGIPVVLSALVTQAASLTLAASTVQPLGKRKRKHRKTKSRFRICGYFFWFRLNHAQPIRMRGSDNWNLYVVRKPRYFVLSQILAFWAWCSILRSCGRAHAVKVSFRVLEWMEAVFALRVGVAEDSMFSVFNCSIVFISHMFSLVFLLTFSTSSKEFQCESPAARLCQFRRIPLRTRRGYQAWEVD